MQLGHRMPMGNQLLSNSHKTPGGPFVTKYHHHEEEFLKCKATSFQNGLTKQPGTNALQAECDVLSEGELNNLE